MSRTTIFMRSSLSKQWSIERVFNDVLSGMPKGADVTIAYAPFRSRGLIRRIGITLWSRFRATQVNHISGDIHFIALGLPRKNTVLTVHDVERLGRISGLKNRIYFNFWFKWPAQRVAAITTISKRSKDDLVRVLNCDPDKIQVIYNPISKSFVPSERPFNTVKPRILHIGTRENKNLERVIESLAGLVCTLVIIGELSQQQTDLLKKHAIDYENVFDLSHDEIVAQYDQCDVVMFPSLFEGFGLVAIEGQACAKPVITSQGRPFDEIVGETACLVDPKDVASIRDGLERVLNDAEYRTRLIETGLENSKRFSQKEIAKEYLDLYQRIAQN